MYLASICPWSILTFGLSTFRPEPCRSPRCLSLSLSLSVCLTTAGPRERDVPRSFLRDPLPTHPSSLMLSVCLRPPFPMPPSIVAFLPVYGRHVQQFQLSACCLFEPTHLSACLSICTRAKVISPAPDRWRGLFFPPHAALREADRVLGEERELPLTASMRSPRRSSGSGQGGAGRGGSPQLLLLD